MIIINNSVVINLDTLKCTTTLYRNFLYYCPNLSSPDDPAINNIIEPIETIIVKEKRKFIL